MKVKIEVKYEGAGNKLNVIQVFSTIYGENKIIATILMNDIKEVPYIIAWAKENGAEIETTASKYDETN